MRLFLSSYRAGKYDGQLLKLLNGIDKVAVITNAKDYKTAADRLNKIKENFDYYRSIGIEPTEIDLRPVFNKAGAEELLDSYKFIWLAGGNVFLLRRALAYTGLDKYLVARAQDNSIILGGESAGAIIIGPTLKYSEMDSDEDSPKYIPAGYEAGIIWEGLSLVDYVPVPHYKSGDYGAEIDKYIAKLDKHSIAHRDLTDEQAILVDGKTETFLN